MSSIARFILSALLLIALPLELRAAVVVSGPPSGGGAVTSVAGKTGVVTLLPADIGSNIPGSLAIGNGTGFTEASMSGDTTITTSGVVTIGKLNGTALGATSLTTGKILASNGTNISSLTLSGDGTLGSTGVLSVNWASPSAAIGTGTPVAITGTTHTATNTGVASFTTPGGYTSTVATGTAPFTATSTTVCPNLHAANADQLLGSTWAVPGALGATTPTTVKGTTITATTASGSNGFTHSASFAGAMSSLYQNSNAGATSSYAFSVWSDTAFLSIAAYSSTQGAPFAGAGYIGNTGSGPMLFGTASAADLEIYNSHRMSLGSNTDNGVDKWQVTGCVSSTGISPGYTTKAISYTALNTDFFIACTATPITITLPTTGMTTGHVFVVCPTVASPTITISATVNGAANPTLTVQYTPGRYIWNGTNYTSW